MDSFIICISDHSPSSLNACSKHKNGIALNFEHSP
uniref:Uncharacterized protein MANES_11G033500 n=1 Tax=Rhizophora mucronata TaxID=61149 RepID=A0A2P2KHP6_RHIMU